ncbi:MAG: dihydrodipicolinate synthase family protein [Actinomycetota bacterium]|nr:dihydrodipicolinate synthase family protein [Actinomycetota bacterium]
MNIAGHAGTQHRAKVALAATAAAAAAAACLAFGVDRGTPDEAADSLKLRAEVVASGRPAVRSALDRWTNGNPPAYAVPRDANEYHVVVRLHWNAAAAEPGESMTMYIIDKRSNQLLPIIGVKRLFTNEGVVGV